MLGDLGTVLPRLSHATFAKPAQGWYADLADGSCVFLGDHVPLAALGITELRRGDRRISTGDISALAAVGIGELRPRESLKEPANEPRPAVETIAAPRHSASAEAPRPRDSARGRPRTPLDADKMASVARMRGEGKSQRLIAARLTVSRRQVAAAVSVIDSGRRARGRARQPA
jgi:hypothetical protein